MVGHLVAVGTLAALLLAGCAGGADDGAANDAPAIELVEVDNTLTRGSISGVVVDETITPVPRVNVSLQGSSGARSAETSADGLFVFEALEPGLYTLSTPSVVVGDRPLLGVQATAEVVAGETAKVRMLLPNDPTPRPYHATYVFEMYDEVTAGIVDGGYEIIRQAFLNGTAPPLCDYCTVYVHPDGPVDTFLLEAVWEDSVEDPVGEATSYYYNIEDIETGTYEDDYCSSPCRVTVSGDIYENVTTYSLSIYPDENWVAYQQHWKVFLTLWYMAPPPEGWSFIAGDR